MTPLPEHHPMNILIAEDELISRSILVGVLEQCGHQVLATCNGSEAWLALQQPDAPRLVLLDWLMPEMDGPEVLRRLRARHTDCPPYVIMLTAKGEKADVIACLSLGANDYLTKPFDPGELAARLLVGQRMVEMQDALIAKAEEVRRPKRNCASWRHACKPCAKRSARSLPANCTTPSASNSPPCRWICYGWTVNCRHPPHPIWRFGAIGSWPWRRGSKG